MKRMEAKSANEKVSRPSRTNDSQAESDKSHTRPTTVSALHKTLGNQAVQQFAENGALQPKLPVSQSSDPAEREAERVTDRVMEPDEAAEGAIGGDEDNQRSTAAAQPQRSLSRTRSADDASVSEGLEAMVRAGVERGGAPLPPATRSEFESRFGTDFSEVRVHTGPVANEAATSINAKAFTYGHDIVFGSGQYTPNSSEGRRLLAHELTHVVQQRSPSVRMIQRDLKAYNKPKSDVLPSAGPMSSTSHILTKSAEAPGIRNALSGLIASGKVKEVKSTDGTTSWFAAQHHRNAQLDEIRQALQNAGYAKADKLARAIYDIHGEFLYANEELETISPFYSRTQHLGENIETQTHRSMTEWEIRQAKRVFGNAIDYSKVTIAEGSISAKIGSAFGYARTVGNTIYFPPGGSRNMAFLIHELTHVWQYQTTGWTYAPKAIWAQVTEGYSYTEGGKSAKQSLLDARAAGKTLFDYNKEQQGDILRSYFLRLQRSEDTSAWQPFINDIKNR